MLGSYKVYCRVMAPGGGAEQWCGISESVVIQLNRFEYDYSMTTVLIIHKLSAQGVLPFPCVQVMTVLHAVRVPWFRLLQSSRSRRIL